MPKVEKIRGLNLPGTPWATSACCGIPLLYFTCLAKNERRNEQLETQIDNACIHSMRQHHYLTNDISWLSKTFIDSTPNMYPRFEGPWLRHCCIEGKERSLKESEYIQCAWFITTYISRLRLKSDGTRAETRFRLSPKRTSPFKSAGASVQSNTGSQGVRISGSNAGYTMF